MSKEGQETSQTTISDIAGSIRDSHIAGRDIVVINIQSLSGLTLGQAAPVSEEGAEEMPECPYRGLFAFRPEHAPFFFGREEFTERLVAAVERRRLVAVLGASGSGKSSVVFAGLVPALARQAGKPWLFSTFRPGHDPFLGLASALVPLYETGESRTALLGPRHDLAAGLRQGRYPLSDVLGLVREAQPDHRLLLIADQFEELYTLCRNSKERQTFLDGLLAVVQDEHLPLPVHLVLTLRADFLGQAALYRPLADALQGTSELLGPMTRAELDDAIEKPAKLQGVSLEAGLVEALLADVGQQAGNLPLLEFALSELWQRQERRTLTHRAYLEIGQVKGALSRHADRAYASLSPEEQAQAHRIFVRLVTPGSGTEDTRRLATRKELGRNWELVTRLADERLVVTSRRAAREGEKPEETVEVVHEALIRHWPQLRHWLEADREFLNWRLGLRSDLARWEAAHQDEGALLRGTPLAVAEGWLASRAADLNGAEQAYIQASLDFREQEAAEREAQRRRELITARRLAEEAEARRQVEARSAAQLRRRALWLIGLTTGVMLLAGAAIFFGWQSHQNALKAQNNFANLLTAQAQNLLQNNPQLAVLLALEAGNLGADRVTGVIRQAPFQYWRINSTLAGHTDRVTSIAWNPEGDKLVSGSWDDGTVIVWDIASGQPTLLKGHKGWVTSVAWNPEGDRLASGSWDGTVIVWDIASGQPTLLEGHIDRVETVAWNPEGDRLASGSWDGTVIVWEGSSGESTLLEGHTATVKSVAWNPEGDKLASGSWDGTVIIWNIASGQSMLLKGHTDRVESVAWSPEGDKLASGSGDGTVIVWDTASGQSTLLEGHTNLVTSVAWSPEGDRLASGSGDGTVIVWEGSSDQPPLLKGDTNWVTSVSWNPEGDKLVSGSEDGTVMVWDVASGQSTRLEGHTHRVTTVAWSPKGDRLASGSGDGMVIVWEGRGRPTHLKGHTGRVETVAWHPEGDRLASGSGDWKVIVWDVVSGQSTRLEGHNDEVTSVAWHPEGDRLASGSGDRTVIVWDMASGQSTHLEGHTDWVTSIAWSPEGDRLASGSWDEKVIVWDVASGQSTRLEGHNGRIESVAWNPQGDKLASGSWDDGTVIIWDIASGQPALIEGHNGRITTVAWNPQGDKLASGSGDGVVIVWDVANGQPTFLEGHAGRVETIAWSPEGDNLASGSEDGKVIVWDIASGQSILLEGHTGRITTVTWHPKGDKLASGSWDRKVIIWDVASGRPALLEGHTAWVWSIAWSPKGDRLASSSENGSIWILPERNLRPPCGLVSRNLTQEEWSSYLGELPYHQTCPNWPVGR